MSLLPLVRLWIWISVMASMAGWALSAIGQLNRKGYVVCLVVGAIALYFGRPSLEFPANWWNIKKSKRRFRRFLPMGFLVLTLLILVGSLLYAPTNHTAITYRIPRFLQWLASDKWHWIHTENYRMNNRACGIEWLSAPFILFTKSDRALFLLNFVPFLLLPGLTFSIFRRLGVPGSVAWHWMWLLPTGYTFLLQAGSTGNDTFPTVYALAALDFGLRALETRKGADLWLSIISAALLTGAKASNLPLLLPWFFLMLPQRKILLRTPLPSALVVILAALVSFLPTAILNVYYCGDWSGLRLERTGMDMKNPIVGIWGNVFLLLLNNFAPPFFPMAGWWNQSALTILPAWMVRPLRANFEEGWHLLGELPTEDWAGLGFGLSVLVVVWVLACRHYRQASLLRERSPLGLVPSPDGQTGSVGEGRGKGELSCHSQFLGARPWLYRALLWSPWISLLAYCVKSGMVTGGRLISPYYPLLLPSLLVCSGGAILVRRRSWRLLERLVIILAIPVLVLTPGRPLWPAQTTLSSLVQRHPDQPQLARALKVYSVYGVRADPLANVRQLLPSDLAVVGFLGSADDPDISLWRPFGTRRVEHILPDDSAEQIRARHLDYVVVGGLELALSRISLDAWMAKAGAKLVSQTTAIVKVTEGPQPWYLVKILPVSGQ
jgi:hypothetical protein